MKCNVFNILVKNIIEGKDVYIDNSIADIAIKYKDSETGEDCYISRDDPIDEEFEIIDPAIEYELSIVEYLGPIRPSDEEKKMKTIIHKYDTLTGALNWASELIQSELGCDSLFQFYDSYTPKHSTKKYRIYTIHACICSEQGAKIIGESIGCIKECPAVE